MQTNINKQRRDKIVKRLDSALTELRTCTKLEGSIPSSDEIALAKADGLITNSIAELYRLNL